VSERVWGCWIFWEGEEVVWTWEEGVEEERGKVKSWGSVEKKLALFCGEEGVGLRCGKGVVNGAVATG